MDHKLIVIVTTLSLVLLGGCTQKSEKSSDVFLYENSLDISYGEDICSYANEEIKKVRYGGRIIMNNGEQHKFMSAECTAGFYLALDNPSEVKSIEVVDFSHGQQYLPVEELVFLQSSLQPSPGGMFLTPIDDSNEKMKTYIYNAYPGTFYTWAEVLELVKEEWNLAADVAKKATK